MKTDSGTFPKFPPVCRRPLDAAVLKYIAALIMVIDHAAVSLIYYPLIVPAEHLPAGPSGHQLYQVYLAMRGIGRIAFPIFCFFIVEGFHYTHSRKRYALRLLVFGLISEIPFDLALRRSIVKWDHQNVMFEFLFAVIMLSVWDFCDKKKNSPRVKTAGAAESDSSPDGEKNLISEDSVHTKRAAAAPFFYTLLQCGSAALLMYLAELFRLDYGWKGLGLILLIYLLRFSRNLQCILGALVMSLWEPPAILSFIPLLWLYNGKRGRQPKWFFYAFYPAHLMILYLLSLLI